MRSGTHFHTPRKFGFAGEIGGFQAGHLSPVMTSVPDAPAPCKSVPESFYTVLTTTTNSAGDSRFRQK